jgi:hypothetical protein
MPLRLATNDDQRDLTPAATALTRLREEIAATKATDSAWAAQEMAEVECVNAYQAAQAEVEALEQRRVAAAAALKVLGKSAEDPQTLAIEVSTLEARLPPLARKAREATGAIKLIRDERAGVRARLEQLNAQVRPAQHAAAEEKLAVANAKLIEVEALYIKALIEAFGVAAFIDQLARDPGPALPFAGQCPLGDLVLPRPFHERTAAVPFADRIVIGTAIAEAATKVAAEL